MNKKQLIVTLLAVTALLLAPPALVVLISPSVTTMLFVSGFVLVPVLCEIVVFRVRLDGHAAFVFACGAALFYAWRARAHLDESVTFWALFESAMIILGLSQFVFWSVIAWLRDKTSNWGRGRPVVR